MGAEVDETDSALQQEYPLVEPYSLYAGLYDELGQSEFGEGVLPLVELAIDRHRLRDRRVLDLACGTGTVAVRMAAKGFRVTGLDRSPEMLQLALEKARAAGVHVSFLQQDMARLRVCESFDLVLCLYDSLNHLLSPEELEAALAGVSRLLDPAGLFIFDVNTVYCLAHDWGNQVAEERSSSAMLVHQYSYDPASRIGTLELLCLVHRAGGVTRFREIHRERGYSREEIGAALGARGLTVLEELSFPDLAEPGDDTSRLIYVTRRRDPCIPDSRV